MGQMVQVLADTSLEKRLKEEAEVRGGDSLVRCEEEEVVLENNYFLNHSHQQLR